MNLAQFPRRGYVKTPTPIEFLPNFSKALGGKVEFVDAVRFEKGEGIEKREDDFAAEIEKMVKG